MPADYNAELPRILAVTYSDSQQAADALRRLVGQLAVRGASCAGFIECAVPLRPGQSRCDMVIENLSDGQRLKISEDRGPMARGCRLDGGALADALAQVEVAMAARPDVLVVNKFGKTEAEGAGFRPLIANAIDHGIGVLIAVPWRNIESWRLFVGTFAREIDVGDVRVGAEARVIDGMEWRGQDQSDLKACSAAFPDHQRPSELISPIN
jgi:nucleoside-triphosphatase THEP1